MRPLRTSVCVIPEAERPAETFPVSHGLPLQLPASFARSRKKPSDFSGSLIAAVVVLAVSVVFVLAVIVLPSVWCLGRFPRPMMNLPHSAVVSQRQRSRVGRDLESSALRPVRKAERRSGQEFGERAPPVRESLHGVPVA